MKLRNLLLAATVLAAPVAAKAQPVNGLYIGGGLGYNYLADVDIKGGARLTGKGGPLGVISAGYGFGNGLRVELEGSYRNSDDRVRGAGLLGGGTDQTYGGMVNALYDFDLGLGWMYPYVGVGAGYQETTLKAIAYSPKGPGELFSTNTSKGGFAAQGIVGAGFPVPGVPGLSITAEYRMMAVVEDEKFSGTRTGPAGPVPYSLKLGDQYNHAGLIGIRYAFGVAPMAPAPAPAPAAAPAPAPARTYLVFFDWDKSDLTDRAKQIISDAAAASTRIAVTRIEVSGYTDRSGTPAYNQGLSVRRANSVAAELVHDGVAKASISVMGFGETHPLVPTAAGVREPQNRRVEIVLK